MTFKPEVSDRVPVAFAHWMRGEPDRCERVYALVLPDGGSVPFVGQYEPKLNQWVSEGGGRYADVECVHSPLPPHEEFREETHLTDSWILRALRLERSTDREQLARSKEDLKVYRLRIARELGMIYEPEGLAEQPCTDEEAVAAITALRKMEKRLLVDPGGSDRIDELEQAVRELRFQLEDPERCRTNEVTDCILTPEEIRSLMESGELRIGSRDGVAGPGFVSVEVANRVLRERLKKVGG